MPSIRTMPGRHDVDVAGDEGAQRLRHAGLDLEADDRAAAAALQRALVQAHEVLGLLLDLDVAVADDPERALAEHLEAGKQQADEGDDQAVERDEARASRRAGRPAGARTARRCVGMRTSALIVRPSCGLSSFERQREAEIRDERERMRRVDGERRQDREDVLEEMLLQPVALAARQIARRRG